MILNTCYADDGRLVCTTSYHHTILGLLSPRAAAATNNYALRHRQHLFKRRLETLLGGFQLSPPPIHTRVTPSAHRSPRSLPYAEMDHRDDLIAIATEGEIGTRRGHAAVQGLGPGR